MTPRLEVRHLSKTFGSMRALSDLNLLIRPGEIHGVAGQNGSGKSTLIKLLTGYHTTEPGAEYYVDGRRVGTPVRWREVHRLGVSVVHQDLGMIDDLTVAENICVGGFPRTRVLRRISRSARDRLAQRALDRLSTAVRPRSLVGTLTAAQRAEVAIARGLRDQVPGAGLLILDESTRALSGSDLDRFHVMLRRLADEGTSILLITHNLPELLHVTDRITILRDGRVAGEGIETRSVDEAEVARLMLGADMAALEHRAPAASDREAVVIRGLSGRHLSDVDLDVGRGEIVGITGLPGSGYEELPYLVTAATQAHTGSLSIGGRTIDLARASVRTCITAGVVLVPERREKEGLAFELSARDNLCMPSLRREGRSWFVGTRWQERQYGRTAQELDVRPRLSTLLVKQLSGGNQQKVLLGKWLAMRPTLLVMHEPTQAVDVGARREILAAIHRAADAGTSVLLVSSEASDLVAVCDRVLILRPGEGLEEAPALEEDAIIEAIYASTVTEPPAAP